MVADFNLKAQKIKRSVKRYIAKSCTNEDGSINHTRANITGSLILGASAFGPVGSLFTVSLMPFIGPSLAISFLSAFVIGPRIKKAGNGDFEAGLKEWRTAPKL